MARSAINVNIGGAYSGGNSEPWTVGCSVPDIAAVVTDTATLVADGASPTQAHVTPLNTHVTALNAAIAGDLSVTWDTARITTVSQLKAALAQVVVAAGGGNGSLTQS